MFHKSNFGRFGQNLPCDMDGFVPQVGDEPDQFRFDGDEFTADFDAQGNGYEGAASEAWDEFVTLAIDATSEAQTALSEWQAA